MDLPNEDHVVRYISKNKILRDEDGNVLGVLPQAFALRELESNLSVNWLEYFKKNDRSENVKALVENMRQNIDVKKGAFAIANVAKIIEAANQRQFNQVKVVHSPQKPNNLSHSSIIRMPQNNDDELMLLLSVNVFSEVVQNKDIK